MTDAQTARLRKDTERKALLQLRLRQAALFCAMLISGGLFIWPRIPLLLLLLVICFSLKNPLRLFREEFAFIWLLLGAIVAVALIGGESFQIMPLMIRYANFIAGLALLMLYIDHRPNLLASDLYLILKLMSFQAILTPIVALVAPGIFIQFHLDELTYQSAFFIFTYHDTLVDASLLKRPDGFFYEPGVLQFYLNAFLFICLFLRRFSAFDIGLATLAVMVTQSTTGALVLVVQFGMAYLNWLKHAGGVQRLGLVIIAPLVLVPIGGYAAINTVEKLFGEAWGSAAAREYDLRTGLRVLQENPVFGIGFDYERYHEEASRVGYTESDLSRENLVERGNTNGIVAMLYSVGIPLGLVFLWGTFRQRMLRPRWLFGIVILLSMLSESLFFTPIFLAFVFSGLLIRPRKQGGRAPIRKRAAPARTQAA